MGDKSIEFPVEMLDQHLLWFPPDGSQRFIIGLKEDEVLWAIDYILANAGELRVMWAIKNRAMYDEGQRPRRWMLDKQLTRALFRRLVAIELDVK